MDRLKRLWERMRHVRARIWLLSLGAAVVLFLVFLGGLYAWDYTNSPPFCGTTCHTMPPHYESYLRSPHARVACVECHIGRTSFGVQFTRKAVDAQFVWAYVTGLYSFPLRAKGLQPARESCEKCHWPEKFSWDKVVKVTDYQTDPANTPVETTLVVKTGGGSDRAGLGRGIHWHIENPIQFYYTDDLQQNIPVIRVTNKDGSQTVYSDIETPLTPEQLAKLPSRQMDCIDCHNRVSHNFQSPSEALDTALATKEIDTTIPNIKQKAIEVLTPLYKTTAEANTAIAGLDQFYQQSYGEYYQQNKAAVQTAVKYIQDLYPHLHFPDQGLDWTTHPDNLGHKEWPGCFRCHDGKHFSEDRKQAIRLECNICHSIPAVNTQGRGAPAISLEQAKEPDSHKTTTWLLEHRTRFDATCQECHDTRNAGGNDNTSFCSNSACHGTQWKYAGFDAPALAQILKPPVKAPTDPNAPPPQIPHPIGGNPDCQKCHALNSTVRPMPADHAGRTNETCQACHVPTIPPEGQATQAGKPPGIPHDLTGRAECLGCHNSGAASMPQIPQSHKDANYTNGICTGCHQPLKAGELTPTPQATISPTAGATGAPTVSATETISAEVTVTATVQATVTAEATGSPATEATPTERPTVSTGIPNMPPDHFTAGCTTCHSAGLSGAPVFPANHANYTNEMCSGCHKQAQGGPTAEPTGLPVPTTGAEATPSAVATGPAVTPSAEATAEATTTPAAQATTGPTTAAGVPPNMPPNHYAAACTTCHATGANGAPKFPASHASYTDAVCSGCHKPS